MHGLRDKGLRRGSVPIIGAVAVGLAATAPAYSLTGALGYAALEVGYQLPIVFAISVIPMLFVAVAYKHLTDAAPDAGTVFTWGSKALAPHIGWFGGWALLLSSILAGVGAAQITVNAAATVLGLQEPGTAFQIAVGAGFILLTTWLAARGAEESSRTTILLTCIQYGGLAVFAAILVIATIGGGADPAAEQFSPQWFNPLQIDSPSALLSGFLVAVFIFWGFDASLAMSEEVPGSATDAGRTGLTAITITVVTYILFSTAALAFAGIDPSSAASLTNEDNIDDVFTVLATESIGATGALLAALVVGMSAFSATMSTVMPMARGVLAMATYRALPDRFATVDQASGSPRFATWAIGLSSLVVFAGLSLVSESVVEDCVYSVGISIMTYYVVVAFSSVVYFWRTAFRSVRTAFGQVLLPLAGGIVLLCAGVIEAARMVDPEYGSGGSVAGIGTVFVLGVLLLLLGIALMAAWRLRAPDFFRGKTLRSERTGPEQ